MPPAAASEKEGRFLGTPQTPAGGLRPPAPPAQQLHENKEWLVYTKLTILIVNFAVKRKFLSIKTWLGQAQPLDEHQDLAGASPATT